MKAVLHTRYRSPTPLQYAEVEKPASRENEVLVRVKASALNFRDVAVIKGQPLVIRLMGFGLLKPKNQIPGGDVAGVVEAVGGKATQSSPGDAVFGDLGKAGKGTFAVQIAKAFGAEVTGVCSTRNVDLVR